MQTLRYKVCDEDGVLRRFPTKTEAEYFMRGKDELRLEVEKRKREKKDMTEFAEALF